jgi:hypothetical protein
VAAINASRATQPVVVGPIHLSAEPVMTGF